MTVQTFCRQSLNASEKVNGCKKKKKKSYQPIQNGTDAALTCGVVTWKTSWKSVVFAFCAPLKCEHSLLISPVVVYAYECFTSHSDNGNELGHPALCGAEASHVVHMWILWAAPLTRTVSGASGNQSWSNRGSGLWNCTSSYTKPRDNGSTTELFCLHPLDFPKTLNFRHVKKKWLTRDDDGNAWNILMKIFSLHCVCEMMRLGWSCCQNLDHSLRGQGATVPRSRAERDSKLLLNECINK